MGALETLLAVQEHDTVIDQLVHRRAHMAERAELATVEGQIAAVEQRRAAAQARRDDVAARQARLEQEIASVEARITDIEKRMYSGSVSASRELQAMSAEVDSLKARRSSLEDDVLAAMEEAEPVDEEVASLLAERSGFDAEAERLSVLIAEAEVAIDVELEGERATRAELASGVPDDLLSTYEKLRGKLGGVGAARLVGPSCTGCHLTLPATELDRIRRAPADTVVFCDQCGRILVH
ncbi:MAG TPA: C4-type zinc ribbon domain-containing protein [Acidimicrobiales bacterium]|nr:C4-type zinc ribbon domain-containing protein [Acidimicrobiales bacterium]